MDALEAIILGLVQGLTEFLPVSSSGHIELAKAVMGLDLGENGLAMSVFLHFATALSIIVVFRRQLWDIVHGLFQFRWNEQTKYSLKILLSMIPAVVVGLLFEEQLDTLFEGNVVFVGCMLLVTAALLYFADRTRNTTRGVSFRDSVIVGLAQAVAVLPGLSRSGTTIATSMLLGINREKAASFSFIMVLPLILGKAAKDILSGDLYMGQIGAAALSGGFLAAFVSGVAAAWLMLNLVKKAKLNYFAVYCLIVGITAILTGLL